MSRPKPHRSFGCGGYSNGNAALDEKFRSMIDEQMNIREELKPVELRMTVKNTSGKLTPTESTRVKRH